MKSRKTVGIAFALVFASFVLSTISSLVSLHVVMRDNVRTMNKVFAMRIPFPRAARPSTASS